MLLIVTFVAVIAIVVMLVSPSITNNLSDSFGFAVHPLYPSFSAAELGFIISGNALSASDDAVYKIGYYSINGNPWQNFTLSGATLSGNWLSGTATYTLPSFGSGENYVVIYSCTKNSISWNCHDGTIGRWQLKIINNGVSSAKIINVWASSYYTVDMNIPSHSLDGNFSEMNMWSAQGDGQWIAYELNQTATVNYLRIAFYYATQRYFDIQYSTNNITWYNTTAHGMTSAANMGEQYQTFTFTPVNAKYIRIMGHGSNLGLWNAITETDINGFAVDLPTITAPTMYCDDGTCNNGETCSTCPDDCGTCQAYTGTKYYVSQDGNDDNSGTSESEPWQTLSHIGEQTFEPGDAILFRRGDIWYGSLDITSSGSSGNPITYGAYGSEGDAKPIFEGKIDVPGWKTSSNWNQAGSNIWRISYPMSYYRLRLWIDGVEVKRSETSSVTTDVPWAWATNYIYVYSTSNPATAFDSIETNSRENFVNVDNKNYITFQNLDVRGFYGGFNLVSSSNIITEYCNIGGDFAMSGVMSHYSSNGIIRHNTFDTFDRIFDAWQAENSEDAVDMNDGSTGWDIYENDFIDWGHTGFCVYNDAESDPIANIKVHHNHFTNAGIDYGRAIGVDVSGVYQSWGIEIYDNFIEDQAVNSQIQAPGLKLYNNIFEGCRGTFSHGRNPATDGNAVAVVGYHGRAQGMEIYNNVFANNYGYGIWLHNNDLLYLPVTDNIIANNIFYNNHGVNHWWDTYGDDYIQLSIDVFSNQYRNTFKNNLFYSPSTSSPIRYNDEIITVAAFNSYNGNNQDIMSGNVVGDPLFVDAANGDFRLQSGSPAINNGINVGLTKDYVGMTVPQGTAPDIGAYEYH